MELNNLKVAIVHDWLVTYAGAERVLEQMINVLPQAELFSLIDYLPEENRGFINNKQVKTSFIQKLPFSSTKYRNYLFLMPLAIEQLDLKEYDLIISSSYAVAKGVLTGPNQLHICMCYSPIRYAWDLQHQYLQESGLTRGIKSWIARYILHKVRIWDTRTSNGVDEFISISGFISRRIYKIYRRESTIIYPPVDTEKFTSLNAKDNYYLTVSRMVPYKKISTIVEAFNNMPEKTLIVIGDGPEYNNIASKAAKNIKLLGHQPYEKLLTYLQKARAFVFAAEEDFGIVALEAQACGTPVIAYGKGGVLETVKDLQSTSPTGLFFLEQTPIAIQDAIRLFEQNEFRFKSSSCRLNAERFSNKEFRDSFYKYIKEKWDVFIRNNIIQ